MIEVSNLKFSYNDKKDVICDVSFTIPKGKWTAIIGHNGSGKSTLAKLLIGLLEAKSGKIIVDGIELNAKNLEKIRSKMGLIFQNPDNQFVGASVRYDIAFGLENQNLETKIIKAKVLEYAKLLKIEKLLDKSPVQLSGGQKQKVALAGLLAMNKEILIFDEASSMLDKKGKDEVIEEIKKLAQDETKTIVTITHDLNIATLADHIIVLKEGKVIASKDARTIFSDQALLESTNLIAPVSIYLIENLKNSKIKNKEEIINLLWEYTLRK